VNTFLVDTNVASVLFDAKHKRHEAVRDFFEKEDGRIYIPVVTWGEIRYGYKVHTGVDEERGRVIESRMKKYEVCNIGKHTSEPYSRIRAHLFREYASRDKKGKTKQKRPESLVDKTTGLELGIQENDLWIVAIAAERNCVFVTMDRMQRLREIVGIEYPDLVWRHLPAHQEQR
jgi:predicted nucleic acid-binding protein